MFFRVLQQRGTKTRVPEVFVGTHVEESWGLSKCRAG